MNKKNNRKGFTIVELVIVIAVIAILATVLVPTFSTIITKANDSKTLQTLRNEYTEYVIAAGDSFADTVIIELDGNYYSYTNGSNTFAPAEKPTTAGAIYWDGNEIQKIS